MCVVGKTRGVVSRGGGYSHGLFCASKPLCCHHPTRGGHEAQGMKAREPLEIFTHDDGFPDGDGDDLRNSKSQRKQIREFAEEYALER